MVQREFESPTPSPRSPTMVLHVFGYGARRRLVRRGGSCTLVQGHAMVPREAMGAGGGGARVVVRGGFARARRRWGRDELGLVGVGGFGRQRIWSDLDPRGRQEVAGWGGFEHHLPLPEVLMPNHSELI